MPRESRPLVGVPNASEELALLADGYGRVAGLDEAGRGCLAGPVVAAAVILPHSAYSLQGSMAEVRDSKMLLPSVRESLFEEIRCQAVGVGVGVVSHHYIDEYGIVPATKLAMLAAICNLPVLPDYLLIDYLSLPSVVVPQKPIVHGDAICLSIAAASIVAKVIRDHLMVEQDVCYPGYGFARNKGYGTPSHLDSLRQLGPCAIHRRTFAPVNCLFPLQDQLL